MHNSHEVWPLTFFTFAKEGSTKMSELIPFQVMTSGFGNVTAVVPHETRKLLMKIFSKDLNICISRTRVDNEKYATVPCIELSEIYPMHLI